MSSNLPISAEIAAVLGGLIFLAKSQTSRPSTIPKLVAEIDTDLARRLYACHDHAELLGSSHGTAVWKAIGGFAGLPHFIAQVRLLVGLMVEIRKHYPDAFDSEWDAMGEGWLAIRHSLGAMVSESIQVRIHPHAARRMAAAWGEIFANLSAEVESALSLYDAMEADSI